MNAGICWLENWTTDCEFCDEGKADRLVKIGNLQKYYCYDCFKLEWWQGEVMKQSDALESDNSVLNFIGF